MSAVNYVTVLARVTFMTTILLPVKANEQSVNDYSEFCSSSTLSKVVSLIKEEFRDVKNLIAANQFSSVEASKQALASALVHNCVPLLIQQNVDGSNFFNRSWNEFKVGFNHSSGNYWLGNDLLSQLTLNGHYKLRFDLQGRGRGWYYAEYSTFRVMNEMHNYSLQVAGYSGNAGGDAFSYHDNMMFTTFDRDNDVWTSSNHQGNCAVLNGGGFWYKNCAHCDVNTDGSRGIFGWNLLSGGQALQSSSMWLKCH